MIPLILLTERQRHILLQLTNYPSGVSMEDLEEEYSISRRTIYREFSNLELYLKEQQLKIENYQSKYQLCGPQERISSLRQELESYCQTNFSNEQRQNALACILLLENDYIAVAVLAYDLEVSEATIYRDLKQLEKQLSPWNLEIEKHQKMGIYIQGDEENRRLLLCTLLLNEINDYTFLDYVTLDNNTDNYFLKLIPKQVLFKAFKAIKSQKEESANFNQIDIYMTYILAVMMLRWESHPINKRVKLSKYISQATKIVQNLHLKQNINSQEIGFIAQQLERLDPVITSMPDGEYSVSHQVRQLIHRVSEKFSWPFNKDQTLYNRLLGHIHRIHRSNVLETKSQVELLNRIVKQYEDLYQFILESLDQNFFGRVIRV